MKECPRKLGMPMEDFLILDVGAVWKEDPGSIFTGGIEMKFLLIFSLFFVYNDGTGMIGNVVGSGPQNTVLFRTCDGFTVNVPKKELVPTKLNCKSEPYPIGGNK